MNRFSGVRVLLLASCLMVPSLALASTQLDQPENNCLTWTLVGAKTRSANPQLLIDTISSVRGAASPARVMGYTPARLGFYLGPANEPPVSIVGQDFRQDLAGRIKYGFYLVSTF